MDMKIFPFPVIVKYFIIQNMYTFVFVHNKNQKILMYPASHLRNRYIK